MQRSDPHPSWWSRAALAVLLCAGCVVGSRHPTASPVSADRTLSARQLAAMLDVLHEWEGAEKKIWLRVTKDDPEAVRFSTTIADVFRAGGWDVEHLGSEGLVYDPGVSLIVVDMAAPPYALVARRAFEAGGIDVVAERGYRAYVAQRVREQPDFHGLEFLPGQTYVVLVGSKPEGLPSR